MYEVHVLAIYHVANAEIECFWGGETMLRTSCIHCKYHFKKKCAIPVEFLYITVQVC